MTTTFFFLKSFLFDKRLEMALVDSTNTFTLQFNDAVHFQTWQFISNIDVLD